MPKKKEEVKNEEANIQEVQQEDAKTEGGGLDTKSSTEASVQSDNVGRKGKGRKNKKKAEGNEGDIQQSGAEETEVSAPVQVEEPANEPIVMPISMIYKGKRYVVGQDLTGFNDEIVEALLVKLLTMMGDEAEEVE